MNFNWIPGRQNSGYFKYELFSLEWLLAFSPFSKKVKKVGLDIYLLKFPSGVSVPTHKDPVYCGRHFRLNITLKGKAKFNGKTIFSFGRIVFFRSDINEHSLDKAEKEIIMFSVGLVI